jgi:hypothetical protein
MTRLLPALLALALVVAYGLAEGSWAGRWQPAAAPHEAAARLAAVPAVLGDWEGTDTTLDHRVAAQAELSGSLMRTYTHKVTGETLTVLLVCGRPGPVSVHTPDVCFVGSGYSLPKPPARQPAPGGGGGDEFWVGDFQQPSAGDPIPVRAYWAWSTDGQAWSAPDHPRLTFARAGALYKLYVTRSVPPGGPAAETDPAADLMARLLPALRQVLAPPPPPAP